MGRVCHLGLGRLDPVIDDQVSVVGTRKLFHHVNMTAVVPTLHQAHQERHINQGDRSRPGAPQEHTKLASIVIKAAKRSNHGH